MENGQRFAIFQCFRGEVCPKKSSLVNIAIFLVYTCPIDKIPQINKKNCKIYQRASSLNHTIKNENLNVQASF